MRQIDFCLLPRAERHPLVFDAFVRDDFASARLHREDYERAGIRMPPSVLGLNGW